MPDPVGDAIAALIDRIEFLEARQTEMQRRMAAGPAAAGRPAATACVGCGAAITERIGP